jgi:hypothetical protein
MRPHAPGAICAAACAAAPVTSEADLILQISAGKPSRKFKNLLDGLLASVRYAPIVDVLLRSIEMALSAKLGNGSRRKNRVTLRTDPLGGSDVAPYRLGPDVLKSISVEKTREAAKCYRHQSLIASTVVAGSAFTLGSSRLSQS